MNAFTIVVAITRMLAQICLVSEVASSYQLIKKYVDFTLWESFAASKRLVIEGFFKKHL